MRLQVGLGLGLAAYGDGSRRGRRPEAAVPGFDESVRGERLQKEMVAQVLLFNPLVELFELFVIVTVVDEHGVPHANEPVALESGEPAHPSVSSSMPVSTSAEQLGQVATAILPTTKEKSHSGHSTLGSGSSGGGGGGGVAPPGGMTPGAVL